MTRDEASARTCQWRQDEHNGIWHSACGPMWPFEEGGPRENGCTYCPRCGGVIEVYAGSFAGWLAAVVEQNTPVAPRDDTAELVEALEAVTKAAYDPGVGAYAVTRATMRRVQAALARVKEAP
ncbi:MAG TPA: hypothetical protein VF202_14815 [Trueperaceae bacterium]